MTNFNDAYEEPRPVIRQLFSHRGRNDIITSKSILPSVYLESVDGSGDLIKPDDHVLQLRAIQEYHTNFILVMYLEIDLRMVEYKKLNFL